MHGILFFVLYCLGATANDAQGLFLALNLELTPSRAPDTRCGARDPIQVIQEHSKCPIYCYYCSVPEISNFLTCSQEIIIVVQVIQCLVTGYPYLMLENHFSHVKLNILGLFKYCIQ